MKNDFCLSKSTLSQFWELCCELASTDKRYRVKIVEWRDKRSLSQNSLYWKWLGEIAIQQQVNETYFDTDTWHEYFKKYWCPEKIVPLPVGQTSVKSTKLLDTGEMHFYLNQIEHWSMDKMIELTIPDDSEYKNLMSMQNE